MFWAHLSSEIVCDHELAVLFNLIGWSRYSYSATNVELNQKNFKMSSWTPLNIRTRKLSNQHIRCVLPSLFTYHLVPSAPIGVLGRGVKNYPTWLMTSWQAPKFPNGIIQYYNILYSKDRNLPNDKWESVRTSGEFFMLFISESKETFPRLIFFPKKLLWANQ